MRNTRRQNTYDQTTTHRRPVAAGAVCGRLQYHFELGAQLTPLRERGVLIVATGNVVHNLRSIDWDRPESGMDWAHRFDDSVREVMTAQPLRLLELEKHPDFRMAAPSPDHFLPLVYLAGLAAGRAGSRDSVGRWLRLREFVHGLLYGRPRLPGIGRGQRRPGPASGCAHRRDESLRNARSRRLGRSDWNISREMVSSAWAATETVPRYTANAWLRLWISTSTSKGFVK